MSVKHAVVLSAAIAALPFMSSLLSLNVLAADYPNKPIRIIAAEPGGGTDFASRLIAQALTPRLNQQVLVENQGAASGVIAAQELARSAPEGYVMLLTGSPMWLLPFMQDNLPYDPVRDFAAVTLTHRSPNVLAVNPSVTATSVKDLIVLAKANPRSLNYGSGGSGSSTHLSAESFKAMAQADITRVPYKGTAPALNALLGGEVQVMFIAAAAVGPHVKSGRLKALAVTGAQRSQLAPDLPTVAASGLPGYEAVTMFGLFAQAQTPPALIHRINEEVVQILKRPENSEKFLNIGAEVVGSAPEQLATAMKLDMAKWGKLIKDQGIRAE